MDNMKHLVLVAFAVILAAGFGESIKCYQCALGEEGKCSSDAEPTECVNTLLISYDGCSKVYTKVGDVENYARSCAVNSACELTTNANTEILKTYCCNGDSCNSVGAATYSFAVMLSAAICALIAKK